MNRYWFLLGLLLLAPQATSAQVQPHRAAYSLRLGTAANAARVGTAVQDLNSDCKAWDLQRELASEVALTPALKFSLASRLTGTESKGGEWLRYRTVQTENGVERATSGEVGRVAGELRVEAVTPDGPERQVLPAKTLMPVAAIAEAVAQLEAGAGSFTLMIFAAESGTAAFQLDVKQLGDDALPAPPPALKPVPAPPGRSWPIQAVVTGLGKQPPKPLLTVRARLFSSGVLERMVVDVGPVTLTGYLQALEMHPVQCSDR